jgi:hypothetical protein
MKLIKKDIKFSVTKATAEVFQLPSRQIKIHWGISLAGIQELPSKLPEIKLFLRRIIKLLK